MADTDEPDTKKIKLDTDKSTTKEDNGTEGTEIKNDDTLEIKDVSTCETDGRKLLKESDVGITEYISRHEGFTAIIKQRFSDFLVNEIDLNNKIVRLDDLSTPPEEPKLSSDSLKSEWAELIKSLQDNIDKEASVEIEVGDDKEARGKIHKAVREGFEGLESTTIDKDGSKYIKVFKAASKKSGGKRQKSWGHKGDFCHFVLYKENKDTNDAVNVISKFMRMKPGTFTFAGTKDKRAKTCQLVSVYRVEAQRLLDLNKVLKGLTLGNFSYEKTTLKLGDLEGNHFTIVLRNVTGSDDVINESMTSLQNQGFINYYGMQRFGTTTIPTHEVGKALLRFKFDEAIDLIMKPRDGDHADVAAARKHWWETRDAAAALKHLGKRPCIERHLLVGLTKSPKADHVGALSSIPRNTRLMYVHAYQSYVWNSVVSKRIAMYGLKPMAGDLVLAADSDAPSSGAKQKVSVLTEQNLTAFSITDVVMPLPGHDIVYPQNEMKVWYQDMLKADGLNADLKSPIRDYSLPGGYRNVVSKPARVKWETCFYDDHTLPLVLSDHERLRGEQLPARVPTGALKALIVEFSLPSSTYATMALREVLKCDTSAGHMTTLNVT